VKLKFSWKDVHGKVLPYCDTNYDPSGNLSPVCCLLMDDGGQDYRDTLPWIEKGIELATSVGHEGGATAEWDREAWGAVFAPEYVTIRSLVDDSVNQRLDADVFRLALSAWHQFLQGAADPGVTREVDL